LDDFYLNRKKHQSNEYIKDAGLNWMDFNFRQYDPQTGRFLSVDPLAAAQGQELHSPYAAMGNQPEMMIDPNGLVANPSMRNLHNKGDAFWAAVDAYYGNALILQEFGSIASYENFMTAQRNIGASAALQDAYDWEIARLDEERAGYFSPIDFGFNSNFVGITSRDVDNRWYYDGNGDGEAGYGGDKGGDGNRPGKGPIGPFTMDESEGATSTSCPTCLDPETTGKNLLGLSYPGGDNPKSFNRKDNYSYVPTDMSEYPAIGHDRRYDKLSINGLSGLLLDSRAIGADWRFVGEELATSKLQVGFKTQLNAKVLGIGLGLFSLPKTIGALSQPMGLSNVIMWYRFSNIGVNNIPDKK